MPTAKAKTTKPTTTYKTKKPWKDGGVRAIATDTCKKAATAAAVAKALSKEREKQYTERTALGVLNWLAAHDFIERVST
jgi:hypothetical protein